MEVMVSILLGPFDNQIRINKNLLMKEFGDSIGVCMNF